MNFRKLILITAAFVSVAVSCKKDEDTEAKPYIQGSMEVTGLPEFVAPHQKCTMKVKGAIHPEGKEIGYCWKVSPVMSKYDTTRYENGLNKKGEPSDGSFTYTFKDSLATYTIYCYAFATGYSSNSTTTYTTVVKTGKDGSITGIEYPAANFTTIGTQIWTVANESKGEGGSFRNAEVMANIFGRYYNYEQAKAACESLGTEWKLPTKEDWEVLESYTKEHADLGKTVAAALMGPASFNGILMWEYWPTVGKITNGTGFSAIPVGYANLATGSYSGTYEYAAFWTSTEVEDDSNMAYYKYLICDQPDLYEGKADKNSFGASVRCIMK